MPEAMQCMLLGHVNTVISCYSEHVIGSLSQLLPIVNSDWKLSDSKVTVLKVLSVCALTKEQQHWLYANLM